MPAATTLPGGGGGRAFSTGAVEKDSIEDVLAEIQEHENATEMRRMLAKQLTTSVHEIRNASKVFELELKKQRGGNEATKAEAMQWTTKAIEIRGENAVLKRENASLRIEVQKLTKLRDAKQADIIRIRQQEAEENNAAAQLAETLATLRAQISNLEREKYSFRSQTDLLQKRAHTTLSRQKSVSQVTERIHETISQHLSSESFSPAPSAGGLSPSRIRPASSSGGSPM